MRAQREMNTGSIFVSLVSYRDSRCEDTLNELFSKCKECDKVFVGLVEQARHSVFRTSVAFLKG
jgi:hypothetical protein